MEERVKLEIRGTKETWEKYLKDGTKDDVLVIPVCMILKSIVEEKDIDIQYAILDGNLDVYDIAGQLDKGNKGGPIIKGNVLIYNGEFRGVVDFSSAIFNDATDFISVIFRDVADFSSATFSSVADFSSATFSGAAYFSSTIFSGYANFNSATFISKVSFPNVNMKNPGDFSDVHFLESTVLKGLWNLGLGRIKCLHWTFTDFSGINTTTIINGASNPYLKRYIDDELWIQSWKERSWLSGMLYSIWELTSHCGRSFPLWAFWILVIIWVFGFAYAEYYMPDWIPFPLNWLIESIDPDVGVTSKGTILTNFTPYYFSVSSMLGFGEAEPQNLAGEIWLAIEILIGYIMLGSLVSIFANTFARRS